MAPDNFFVLTVCMWNTVSNTSCFQGIEFQEQEQMWAAPSSSSHGFFLSNCYFILYFINNSLWGLLTDTFFSYSTIRKFVCREQDAVSCQTEVRWEVFKKGCLSAETVSLSLNSLCAGGAHQAMLWRRAPHDKVSNLLNGKFLSVEWNWIYEKDLFASMCVTKEFGVFHCQTLTRWPSLCQPWFTAKLR